MQHVQPFLEKLDEGQKKLALQSALVEPVGRPVGRGDHDRAAFEQRLEQAAQDHRVGDVDDMQFVETEQPGIVGDVAGDRGQKVVDPAGAAPLVQPVLDFQHEFVEVDPAFAGDRGGIEEQVHEHGFAAPDAAKEIQAARRFGRP